MSQQAAEKISATFSPPWLDNLASPNGVMGTFLKNAQTAFETSVKEYSDETLSFINRRLEHNGAAIEEYRACKDVGALMAAQQKWLTELAHDYFDETVRISEVTRRMLASGLSTASNNTKHGTA